VIQKHTSSDVHSFTVPVIIGASTTGLPGCKKRKPKADEFCSLHKAAAAAYDALPTGKGSKGTKANKAVVVKAPPKLLYTGTMKKFAIGACLCVCRCAHVSASIITCVSSAHITV
jgi:hypothetical protein